ncbi:MAG: 3-phosphoshikimate 1-carboxyvinyltransferase [Actinobacteria bacterium]|nr:3-phosphoshikimate 1-carboxyvinyltransferase [Actinomycetota bacterium]
MNEFVVSGPLALRGHLRVPGDKGISHRALFLAAAAEGRSVVRNLATGADVASTRALVEALGTRVTDSEPKSEVRVQGGGWNGLREPSGVLDCGNSGTTARLGLGYLAGRPFHAVLAGDASLSRRPMRRVVEPLRTLGAHIDGRGGGDHLPLSIRGGELSGARFELPVASAQVKTALLFAGLQASGTTEVVSPARSRDHTERMLRAVGVPVTESGQTVRVGAASIPAFEVDVPGDPSSAAFFLVAALIAPSSELEIEGVSLNPTRIAFVDVLRRMGADVEVVPGGESCGEPWGTIVARTSVLGGTLIEGPEIPLVIDELPVLAVAAAFAEGETEIRDAEELAVKETNRIGAVTQELSQMGVEAEARRDGLLIRGGHPVAGRFKSHGDHRVAMAAVVAALGCQGESRIQGWRAVGVSYPEFADHLALVTRS